MNQIEGAGAVREEDSFDVVAVRGWLRERGIDLGEPVEVRQFGGGASNLTYSLRTPRHDWILRRPPSGRKAAGAHDMGREYKVQQALAAPFGLTPRMVVLCEDESVIGCPFYVMERIDGVIPRRDLPAGVELDHTQVRRLCENALDTLVRLHRVDTSRPEIAALGKGEGYVARQVRGWNTRYGSALTDDATPFDDVRAWLDAHQPADVGNCVIHNDFRFDNLVLDREDPARVVGVLDWEMATLGDPLMDLGGTMAYWVEADDDDFFQRFRRQPTTLPGMFTRAEFVERYCERMGFHLTVEQWQFYEVFGLFRLAAISQQIYYRYFHRQTTNEMFALFGPAAAYLGERCRRIISARSDTPPAMGA